MRNQPPFTLAASLVTSLAVSAASQVVRAQEVPPPVVSPPVVSPPVVSPPVVSPPVASPPVVGPPVVVYVEPPAKRLPIYWHFMLFGGAFVEDDDHRLTTRNSRTLEGFGAAVRIGGYVTDNHRLGGRAQVFTRPTKKVARDTAPDPNSTASKWGSVEAWHLGPEYLYRTNLGLYAAASAGVGFAYSEVDRDECSGMNPCERKDSHPGDSETVERGSAGLSGIGSVGYEWRAHRLLTVNAEIFGGVYRGVDDDENSLTNATYGFALGLGF